MNILITTNTFVDWLGGLKDQIARARILQRLDGAIRGNFGDNRMLGGGLYEMRVHCGPGYRVYFARRFGVTYLLVAGGDKSSQSNDIKIARRLIEHIDKEQPT